MDIANYLSELLNRHGKISVPGLGNFTQLRVNGYYNEAEGQLYPPAYQIQFDPSGALENDDTLVQYIAEKKKISLASSKYFTEKYITGLRQEVVLNEVAFANLGWFYMDQDQIAFRSQEKPNDGPGFYGYAPIAIKKLNQAEPVTPVSPSLPADDLSVQSPEVDEPEVPVVAPLPADDLSEQAPTIDQPVDDLSVQAPEVNEPEMPVTSPLPVDDLSVQPPTVNQPEVYADEEQEEPKRSVSIWVIALIIVVILAAAAFALYKYNPALFNGNQPATTPVSEQPQAQPATKPDSINTDTNKTTPPADTPAKAISGADTTLNKTVLNTDTATQYVIFAGSFKTQAKSDLAIRNYKSIGVDARILSGPGTGKRIKVVIGGFDTYKEGETLRLKLVKSGKLRKDSYTQIINQKK